MTVTSDASGLWGCRAYTNTGQWFQLPWPANWMSIHIMVKKTSPNSLGVHVWGQQWEESLSWHWLTTQQWWLLSTWVPAKTLKAMHLMRCLFFCLAQCGCTVKAAHIQGCRNVAVDGGMATTAAKVESKDSIIKTLGCWESTAYLQYMKIPRAKVGRLHNAAGEGEQSGTVSWETAVEAPSAPVNHTPDQNKVQCACCSSIRYTLAVLYV